jgi:hypothetical protein
MAHAIGHAGREQHDLRGIGGQGAAAEMANEEAGAREHQLGPGRRLLGPGVAPARPAVHVLDRHRDAAEQGRRRVGELAHATSASARARREAARALGQWRTMDGVQASMPRTPAADARSARSRPGPHPKP